MAKARVCPTQRTRYPTSKLMNPDRGGIKQKDNIDQVRDQLVTVAPSASRRIELASREDVTVSHPQYRPKSGRLKSSRRTNHVLC